MDKSKVLTREEFILRMTNTQEQTNEQLENKEKWHEKKESPYNKVKYRW